MISGQDSQTSGIDRDRLVQSEFGRKIGYGSSPEHTGMTSSPGNVRCQIFLHTPIGVIDPAEEDEFRCAFFQFIDGNLLEERNRVITCFAPQYRVYFAEETGCIVVPTPPQILCKSV